MGTVIFAAIVAGASVFVDRRFFREQNSINRVDSTDSPIEQTTETVNETAEEVIEETATE